MKDKNAEQRLAKQRHKEQLKAQRRSAPSLERPFGVRAVKPSILIVCEGKNTEPSYFNQFRLTSATIELVGTGNNNVSLVKEAKRLSNQKKYNQVWCVFDADPKLDNPKQTQNFNEAIKLAEKYGFGLGYSNQAFEYWLILHFDDHQGGGMHRNDYNTKINELLEPFNVVYDGNGCKTIEDDLFELLVGIDEKTKKKRVELAITRAERNYNHFDHSNPAKEESSTTVFRLVIELMKYQ